MRKYYCDICGKEWPDHELRDVRLPISDKNFVPENLMRHWRGMYTKFDDVCPDCVGAVLILLGMRKGNLGCE